MAVTTTVLEREMYTEAGAARLLRLPPGTLHYWLEGGERRGKTYKPVIREEATGSRSVTWAEFIEAGLLRQYRRSHNVAMVDVRNFIDAMRQRTGVPYPLAHYKPFASGRQLLYQAQTDAGLPSEWALVAPAGDQLLLLPPAQAFVDRVVWSDDIASAWRPDSDLDSLVIVDPDVRFGRPSVGGVSTEILAEQADSGIEELAEMFDLTEQQVRWALSYELAEQAA